MGAKNTSHLFIVGVQRCATTYLWHMLDEHPQIAMAAPVRPEPKVLLEPSLPFVDPAGYRARLFGEVSADVRVWGEKSTSYADSDLALGRIADLFDGPVIVSLRDPVQRAVSHWRLSTAAGWETLPADRALIDPALEDRDFDPTAVSASPFHYLRRGRFVDTVRRVRAAVGDDRLVVTFYEELTGPESPTALAGIYARVGVDPTAVPRSLGHPRNVSEHRDPVPDEVEEALRHYYRDWDAELADELGRTLPWP